MVVGTVAVTLPVRHKSHQCPLCCWQHHTVSLYQGSHVRASDRAPEAGPYCHPPLSLKGESGWTAQPMLVLSAPTSAS
jgi:hypothetical protein